MASLREYAHLQISLEEIKLATNNFNEENIIGRGGFGKVYKGQLLLSEQSIDVAAKRLDHTLGQGDVEFLTQISMLSRLKHENLVSIVGFCDENDEKIIVTEREIRGSLKEYLSDLTLTWIQRLQICIGAVRAFSYIHYDEGRNYGVIHRNIKSSKILLTEEWKAKISGFGLSIRNPTNRKQRLLLSQACGTPGYVDPVYFRTGGVTYKSDSYSFGVVLLEVVCGRCALIGNFDDLRRCLVPLAKHHYEEGKFHELIHPYLRRQMEPQSLSIFLETTFECLGEQRANRPNMDQILKRLEKALKLQHEFENPPRLEEPPRDAVQGISSNQWKGKNLEHLKITLKDIKMATRDFDEKNHIGSGAFGIVYKADIDHFDNENSSVIEGTNIGEELSKRRSTVAIKRIFNRGDNFGEEGFYVEIETLTSCKHRNIVSLLGFCDEGPEMILVYEHACNGSLDDYLEAIDYKPNLTWASRLRICLDIAHGLNYLHNNMDKERIIHRDLKSANILLGKNLEAKIADFGLSKSSLPNQQVSYFYTYVAGTEVYLDPEYKNTKILRKESDIYSFGVVLFEILSGRLAYDKNYNGDLPLVAHQRFKEGTLKKLIDPKIMEETDQNTFSFNKGVSEDSLDLFLQVAYQCLAATQAKRPKIDAIINALEKALDFQENRTENLKISLEDIKMATENFNDKNIIGKGGFGRVYRGEFFDGNQSRTIAVKRHDVRFGQGEQEFLNELDILFEYKHKNIIGLLGYCNENEEKIIVYAHAPRGSLDSYLSDASLTWTQRLKICIDVAIGLYFLHGGVVRVIHKDIKTSNILLDHDWEAKITDFGLSAISAVDEDVDYIIDNVAGTLGYIDPLYYRTGVLTKESDIYSFGVVLIEILSGRPHFKDSDGRLTYLANPFKRSIEEEKLDEIIFDGIKADIVPKSLSLFSAIAYQSLSDQKDERPTAHDVVVQLTEALDAQEDYEMWEHQLPKNYKDIIQMSESPKTYSEKKKKDLYDTLSQGMLLQEGKVLFSLNTAGNIHEMVSATIFSYKNQKTHKSESIIESRFPIVAKMLDISNLKIQIQVTTQFLSPGITYGVHLVFKFCDPRKFSTKPMYVNLKYKMGSEVLHTYFATWRDEEWMMIELCRFLNQKEVNDFEVLLESFSRYYCGSGAIYVEGIEFRAVDDVKNEEEDVQGVLKSNSDMDCVQQLPTDYEEIMKRSEHYVENASKGEVYSLLTNKILIDEGEKLFSLSKVNGKKCHMLPAKLVLYNYSNVKCFTSKRSASSRFEEVIQLLSHHVFGIKCNIESQMLSPNTRYGCYLVFELSNKCRGLQCPVKVRDLLHRETKDTKILYFRSPNPSNLQGINWVPKRRKDGWMEVIVWEFNSNFELNSDHLPLDLILKSYEGTMCGLIVCGLEFRPM